MYVNPAVDVKYLIPVVSNAGWHDVAVGDILIEQCLQVS